MGGVVEYRALVQGSDEWLEARRGIVTASVVGRLVTPSLKVADNETSRTLTRLLVAERITGWIEPTFTSDAMLRGQMDEPLARDHYAQHYAPVDEFGFMKRDLGGGWLGYSPDGVVGDDGLIEIKSAEPKIHLARILGAPVEHQHTAQMQAGMLVSGRSWCDYVSWCGGMPMHVERIEASDEWASAIIEAVHVFESNAVEMVAAYTNKVAGKPTTTRIEHFPEARV